MYVADIFVSPKNYSLVILEFLFTTLAIVFVLLRVFTRLWIVKNIGFDDAFIVLSTFGTLGFLIAVMEQIRYGLGDPPDPALLSPFIQATTASVISYTICHLAVKLSISIQCLRIFTTPFAKRVFIGMIVFLSVYGTLCLLLTIMTCWPVQKYWDDSIPGKCLDNRSMRYAFAGINIVNDIVLLVAPMPFLKNLQMAKRAKYVLMGVFAAGAVACVIAIVRLYSLWAYSSVPIPERPVKGIEIAIWSGLECNIAILCACIPSLKPLLAKAFPGLVGSLSGTKYGSHGYGTHNSSRNRHASRNDREHHASELHIDTGGIQVQRSFEMTAVAPSDTDSEKNLVTGTVSAYHSEIYANATQSAATRRE